MKVFYDGAKGGSNGVHGAGGMTTALLDPHSADRLVKLLGMLGSDHPGERAVAGLKASTLVCSLGLRWADIITVSPATRPPIVWRRMVLYCHGRRSHLAEHERDFVVNMVRMMHR